ncbi:MAG TPA: DoxX family protein [Pseudonocardiaceae bacterium]
MTAAVFVMVAVPKLTADPQAVAGFTAMGLGQPGMYIIGCLEIAGAIALLIPLLCGLAGLAFVGLMIGAVITTLLVFGAGMVAMPAVVLLLAAIIAWGRRSRTAQLIALVGNYTHR